MTYEDVLRKFKGDMCKCLPIQGVGMWELVVPSDESEHNGILQCVGQDCIVVVRDDEGPTRGLAEVIPYSHVATFIPRFQEDAVGPRSGRTSKAKA